MAACPTVYMMLPILIVTLLYSCEGRRCSGGPNDRRTGCGSHCPLTCENPNPGPCRIMSSKLNTYECRSGYVRRNDGQRVELKDCDRDYDDNY